MTGFKRNLVLTGLLSNLLEIYDFSIYGYFAAAIAAEIFPAGDYWASLVNTYAVFFIGFMARPLGAWFFGRMGDNAGRKKSLLACVIVTALATAAIGLVPS